MKRKRILVTSFAVMLLSTLISAHAASARLTWSGQKILGLESRGNFKVSGKTYIKIENTVIRARGVPNAVKGTLKLRKRGMFTYSPIYTMNLDSLGYDYWNYTITSGGTYDVYIESYKINGKTNPIDCDGAIY